MNMDGETQDLSKSSNSRDHEQRCTLESRSSPGVKSSDCVNSRSPLKEGAHVEGETSGSKAHHLSNHLEPVNDVNVSFRIKGTLKTASDKENAKGSPLEAHHHGSISEEVMDNKCRCLTDTDLPLGTSERTASTIKCRSLENRTALNHEKASENPEVKEQDDKKLVTPLAPNVAAQKDLIEADSCDVDVKVKEKMVCKHLEDSHISEEKNLNKGVDDGSPNYWKKVMEQRPENQIGEPLGSKSIQYATGTLLGKQEISGSISEDDGSFRTEDGRNTFPCKLDMKIKREGSMTSVEKVNDSKVNLEKKNENFLKSSADMEFAYAVDDALEVARQVAKEVEEEVGIYREALCSSSCDKDMNIETTVSTADSIEAEKHSMVTGDEQEQITQDSSESSDDEMGSKRASGCEGLISERKDVIREEKCSSMMKNEDRLCEQESSQLTTMAQESATNDPRHLCGFDLNEEADYPDQSMAVTVSSSYVNNLTAPIPVVGFLRGPVSLPVTPLHFEGKQSWIGSAATSAFRPASLRRTPDKDSACSVEESNSNLKHSQRSLCIDLNVADSCDDTAMDLLSQKEVPISSGHPSGDSSIEVSSRRAEKLNLDLNRLSEQDDNCKDLLSDWRMESRLPQLRNGVCSPSPTSSSRPCVRDFDLNDNPSSHSEVHDRQAPQGTGGKSGISNVSVVSIMGTRVEVNCNNAPSAPAPRVDPSTMQNFSGSQYGPEFMNQSFLLSGPALSMAQVGRVLPIQATLAYTGPPAFAYNGMGLGHTIPLPSSMYASGGVPYMVDSRGATVVPQIMGPGSLSFQRASPYVMGVASASAVNGIGISSRPNLDLNNSMVEEQMKSFQQVASSGSVPPMKRKEPECGWDSYQFAYKHNTSWR
ncbi:uncharacterized protein LOC18449057 [Amborella trichopoda]|nr:uncharacterized protein LOC18449057 [Amborella trichopoda]|eukprot:XP_006859168.2 uncharacterized protein LOC18449057 [Amborella trichopoda]